MNKFYMIILSFILGFTLVMYGNIESSAVGNKPIEKMIEVFQNNEIQIDEWTMYAKEAIHTVDDFESFEKEVQLKQKQTNNSFDWSIEKENEKWIATGVRSDEYKAEKIKIISTLKYGKLHSYIVYDVKGDRWEDSLTDSLYNSINSTIDDIFLENPTIFTCIKGEYNDKMEGVLYNQVDYLLEEFNAAPIESVKEETFVSVSAYTENWKNDIPTLTEKMNIQIALRKSGLGGKTTVVVGTPIITSEY